MPHQHETRSYETAVEVLCDLERDRFDVEVVNGRLRVTPGDRLMAERESVIRQHRDDLVSLVRELDNGVQFRRSLFVRQLESTPAPAVPCFLVTPGLPYQRGICFSCGDPSEATRFRRCWRCSLAWQLATGVGQPK